MSPKLPDKPSELLELALNDLRAIEKDPGYTVSMHVWHGPTEHTCHVCLAGAVMANTLKVPYERDCGPDDIDEDIYDIGDKLRALDWLRTGQFKTAMMLLKRTTKLSFRHVASYHRDKSQFYADMTKIIEDLKAEGN